MKQELIASLSDIEAIIAQCSNCNSQVKIPVRAPIGNPRDLRIIPLAQCPVCMTSFDSTLRDYVKAFIASLNAHQGSEKISILLTSEKD